MLGFYLKLGPSRGSRKGYFPQARTSGRGRARFIRGTWLQFLKYNIILSFNEANKSVLFRIYQSHGPQRKGRKTLELAEVDGQDSLSFLLFVCSLDAPDKISVCSQKNPSAQHYLITSSFTMTENTHIQGENDAYQTFSDWAYS